jgi:MFS family permease
VTALARQLVSQLFRASPLRHARFRRFYFAAAASAMGYTMQATVAAWLMATLTPSAFMVSLVQTASNAPALLLGLAAGTLADIVDQRRVILATHAVLLVATALLGIATLFDKVGPEALLAFTFLIGAVFTFYWPAQTASINEIVTRADLPRAVALNAVAFNVSRAAGPALAGALAAWLSTGSALVSAAMLFAVMLIVLWGWQSPVRQLRKFPETLLSGMQSGLRYARHSPPLRSMLIHNVSFTLCAAALWGLLPVIARDQLAAGAGGFGLLSASFGIGAVVGAFSIPHGLHRTSLHTMVRVAVVLWVLATLLIAVSDSVWLAIVGAFGAGAAWVGVLASLSAGTQTAAPAWVRARAVAMNLMATQASIAIGSAMWGSLASQTSTRVGLAAASGLMLVLLAINRRIRIALGEEADVTPGVQLPDLAIAVEPLPDDGPVLIQLEYRIDAEQQEAFLAAVQLLEPVRRRNGASDWRVFRDLSEEGRFVERFVIQSWGEYVRLRTRMTVADRQLVSRAEALQRPGVPVRVSRLIGVNP